MEPVESKSPAPQGGTSLRNNPITTAPVSFSKRMGFGGSEGKSNSFRVQKREYITTLHGSTSFNVSASYHINPGLDTTFPWLWETAVKWQQYKFHRFRAFYISRASTSTPGSVIISPEYNISDGIPTDKREALDTQDAVVDNTWKELQCDMDIKAMFGIGPRKQVRRGPISSDLATYDSAIVSFCTDGQSNTNAIGEIWFEYDVEFFVPQSTQIGSLLSQRCNVYLLTNDVSVTHSSNVLLDQWTLQGSHNPLNVVNFGGLFTLQDGTYRIDYLSSVGWAGTSVSGSNVQALIYQSGTVLKTQAENSTAGTGGYGGQSSIVNTIIYTASGGSGALSFNVAFNNTVGYAATVANSKTMVIITIM